MIKSNSNNNNNMQSFNLLALLIAASLATAVSAGPANHSSARVYTNGEQWPRLMQQNGPGIIIKLTRNITMARWERNGAPQTSYFGVINVGSNNKLFNVVFDLGAKEIWIPEFYSWFSRIVADNLHYDIGYDYKDSRTASYIDKNYRFNYRNTDLKGDLYEDDVTLIELATKDQAPYVPTQRITIRQKFLSATDAGDEQFRWKPYDGVVGLSPGQSSAQGIPNLLLALQREMIRIAVEQDPDARIEPGYGLLMGLCFNTDFYSTDGGELTLGNVDHTKFIEPVNVHRLTSYDYWQIGLNRVELGRTLVSCPRGCFARFDTAVNSIVGPEQDVESIRQALGADYDQGSDLWLVACDRISALPSLVFHVDGIAYQLPSGHYTRAYHYKGTQTCYLTIKPWDAPGWLLGTSFLSAYYTIYDFAEHRIGIASTRF